ncbi:MAG TPA: DNRLRE domain-containing protein, partial [Dehalococcoidia bacterium]|nr:DNRLRE domain-containing protein [Dehalococcoidia bacterium]
MSIGGMIHRTSYVGAALLAAALILVIVAVAGNSSPPSAEAATSSLNPVKDNTLYEYFAADGDRSNGAGDRFFAGKTDQGRIRRGVLAFNIAGGIPAGSTITSVTLSMNMSRTNLTAAQTIELRKLLADWGEGTSNAGQQEGEGIAATTNDATWRHRFYNATLWAAQGGDFSATLSASQSVSGTGLYTWGSAQMVTDVQGWLNSPSSNFGWLVRGNETADTTAKRFDSRESNNPPVLTIIYTPPATATPPVTPTPTGPTPTPSPTPTASPTPTPSPTPVPTPVPFSNPLFAPPVVTDSNINISIEEACIQILPGPCTNMWTYGGTYPGVTIRRPTG